MVVESSLMQSLTLNFFTEFRIKFTCTSSLSADSQTTLFNWIVSFTPYFTTARSLSLHHSLTNLSCHDSHPHHRLSIALYVHHLTSHHQHSSPLSNTRPLPATLSSLYDILILTKQTSSNHPTSCILHVDLSLSNCLIPLLNNRPATISIHFSSFHSTSQSPHLHFTITASSQLNLCLTPNAPSKSHRTRTTANQPIHPTPITTSTPQTTPFPLPSQQTYSPIRKMLKMIIKSQPNKNSSNIMERSVMDVEMDVRMWSV